VVSDRCPSHESLPNCGPIQILSASVANMN
jgi:hypothetical protein